MNRNIMFIKLALLLENPWEILLAPSLNGLLLLLLVGFLWAQ